MTTPSSPRVFISVAEQSADEHAAALIRAFRERAPNAVFAGLTGPAMRAAGCETFHDMTARSAMALAAIRRAPEALWLLHRLKTYLAEGHFDAAVMVDSPTLNLPIAKLCRRQDIPVLYYIAPQTWAWASWRNGRVRRRINRLACIWPFEEPYFRGHGIPATYVGHPSFDHLLPLRVDPAQVAALRAGAAPVITLLPGSRAHVVREVFPGQLEVAATLKKRFPGARFLVVPANYEIRCLIGAMLDAFPKLKEKDIKVLTSPGKKGSLLISAAAEMSSDPFYSTGAGTRTPPAGISAGMPAAATRAGSPTTEAGPGTPTAELGAGTPTAEPGADTPAAGFDAADTQAMLRAAAIKAADLVLVASGTVTLEVMYHHTPMIVMYNAGRWMYELIGKRLISTPFLSIPNILAGREVVPEFMPYYRTVDPIIARAGEWLSTPATLARIRKDLAEIIRPIVKPGAARNAAAELASMIGIPKTP